MTTAVVAPTQPGVLSERLAWALDSLDSGEHATKSRDFGRGVAYAVKIIRAAVALQESDTTATRHNVRGL